MTRALFAGSRFVVGLAIVATFAGSVVLLVLAAIAVLRVIWVEISNFSFESHTANHVDHLGVQFIEITDTILLSVVMYIVSLGLYQLFIDQSVPVPRCLRVRDLTELKRDLIGVTVVLLGVTFLGEVVDWDTQPNQSKHPLPRRCHRPRGGIPWPVPLDQPTRQCWSRRNDGRAQRVKSALTIGEGTWRERHSPKRVIPRQRGISTHPND